jgi:hypothetical protein
MSETPQVDQKTETVAKPEATSVQKAPSVHDIPQKPGEADSLEASARAIDESGANDYKGKGATELPKDSKGKVVNPADTKKAEPKQTEPSPEEMMKRQQVMLEQFAQLPPEQREQEFKAFETQGVPKDQIEAIKKRVALIQEEKSKLADAKHNIDAEVKKAEKEVHIESEAKDDTKAPAASESKPQTSTVNEKINHLLDKLKNNPVTNILTLPVRVVRYIFGVLQRLAQSAVDFIKR